MLADRQDWGLGDGRVLRVERAGLTGRRWRVVVVATPTAVVLAEVDAFGARAFAALFDELVMGIPPAPPAGAGMPAASRWIRSGGEGGG